MAGVLMIGEVEDYNTWRKVFESKDKMRSDANVRVASVWHGADNPANIYVLLEADDLDTIKRFTTSDELRQAWKQGGLVRTPTMYYLEEVGRHGASRGAAG